MMALSFLRDVALFFTCTPQLVRRKFWLLPIFIVMAPLGGLIVFTKGSAIAPGSDSVASAASAASTLRMGMSGFVVLSARRAHKCCDQGNGPATPQA